MGKGGKGKFGVGDERDELKGNDDADAELNQDEAAEPEEPKEPEVPIISYDEFMATQNSKKASYKSFAVIEKKDEDGAIFERSKVKKVRKKKVKEVKTLALNFKYADKEKSSNYGGDRRGPREGGNKGGDRRNNNGGNRGGGRGGRGGGRGGGRNNNNGGRNNNNNGGNRGGNRGPNFAQPNDQAFPTLG